MERKNPLLHVSQLEARHEAAWRELWAGYLAYHCVDFEEAITANTWRMIMDPKSDVIGLGAECTGELVGFANVIVHERTWALGPTGYLEDLFVADEARGCGIGASLIRAAQSYGRSRGWSSLYWHAHKGNRRARALYDCFTEADDFVRYRIRLE